MNSLKKHSICDTKEDNNILNNKSSRVITCLADIPIPIHSLKISTTDSHRSDTYISGYVMRAGTGGKAYLPLDCKSRIKENLDSNANTSRIHVIPKELFEALVESKVDPDVLSDSSGLV